jgi:archaellum component FlaG (FlaF/FlaG flagellin family)
MTVTNLIILLNGILVGMLVYKTDRLRHEINNLAKADLQMIEVIKRLINNIGRKES